LGLVIKNEADDMKFFSRPKHNCKKICHLYKAPKTVTSEGVVNQFKCSTCDQYIFPNGIEKKFGNKICRCCGEIAVYVKSIKDDPDLEDTKKSIPNSFTKETFGKKTFTTFLDFIEDEIQLQANYQLVTLKFLIGSKMSEKIEIAEELAYQNNKNFNDSVEVEKFLSVPVYDVLENRGFIKKIVHNDEEQYMLNIEMTDLEAARSLEIIEKKLNKYNFEHNIPENEFDSLSNDSSAKKTTPSNADDLSVSEITGEAQKSKNSDTSSVNESSKIETTVDKLSTKKILFLENSSNGIMLKEYVETKSEEIIKGQVLSNDDLIEKFGVGNMGGIRYSKKNDLLTLYSTLSDDYSDSLDPKSGLYVYSGEGQTGDQELTRGNKKIVESECKMLFFREKYQRPGARKRGALDNLYEFVGPVNYVKHFWVDENDKEGNLRKSVKFVLEIES
jgi:hypothetical protein